MTLENKVKEIGGSISNTTWKGLEFTPPGYPDLGLLLLVDLPLFTYGIYSLVVSKDKKLK